MATAGSNSGKLNSGITPFKGTASATPMAQTAGETKRMLRTLTVSEKSTLTDGASTARTQITRASTRSSARPSTRAYSNSHKDEGDESPSDSPGGTPSHSTDPETSSSGSASSHESRENTDERELGNQFKGARQVYAPRKPWPVTQMDGKEATAGPRTRRVLGERSKSAVAKTGPRKRRTVVHNPSEKASKALLGQARPLPNKDVVEAPIRFRRHR